MIIPDTILLLEDTRLFRLIFSSDPLSLIFEGFLGMRELIDAFFELFLFSGIFGFLFCCFCSKFGIFLFYILFILEESLIFDI
ncbi:MAG: hypothetical protein ACD_78C00256G0003 [uncultured bacterium (gcode 4)]|uniref:Uncharacterized protein n=1 Tax=uncultured bacterium (gcode 4) TaxID=1234023 RepID=K1XXW6_9BACT|nr:MAG: hypothetical protein ACD_78C00256G0003 [uncultured bacterium (gcode 4)]